MRSEERDTLNFLSKVPIFTGLKPKELQALERIVHTRHYKSNEIIFRRNDPGVGLYVIRNGAVRIVLSTTGNGDAPEKGGRELLLAKLQPGDFFGEASLPDGGPRSATALADDETVLMGLFRPDLLDFCRQHGEIGNKVLWNICEVLAVRLRQTNQELTRIRNQRLNP